MKATLSCRAKRLILNGILKQTISKYNLQDAIIKLDYDQQDFRNTHLVISTNTLRTRKNFWGHAIQETHTIEESILEIRGNDDHQTSLFSDDEWYKLKVISASSRYDHIAEYLAKELERYTKVTLVCHSELLIEKYETENPSSRE